eukprot:CAMPEP_0194274650 /NCGR_PEP_ID=MMETSP0169-20130528/7678_1 /TAXON_ID=218684 /ORGANISM="Corethron pennatum, Strain L29A3" /LENGTH=342 /DNA_ID=CAMNT_0039017901 /DNA_START=125 /DNA_END=1153 /DNA_ORIENTATION=+
MDTGERACYSCLCVECIRTQQVGVVENFGQYSSMLSPGMNVICYPLQTVTARLSLRIQQLDIICETKTKDNVFVTIGVAVQYRILSERAYDAHYRLTDPHQQIRSYVYDVVRSTVPKMDLDHAFANKNKIAESVRQQLTVDMTEYGYEIKASLVTDFSPDKKVKQSMNQINASKRLKEAAAEKAEACKIKQVKAAEAEAEARYLSGIGVARQRKAIIQGLQTSVVEFADEVGGITSKEVMDVLLLTQYMEALSTVGANTLFLEHDPACVSNLQQQVSSNFMQKASSRVRKQKAHDIPDGEKSMSRERSKRKTKKETSVKGNLEQMGEDVLGSFGNMGKAVFG